MLTLDYDAAHEFVKSNYKAHWDGWTIVLHTPSHRAWKDREGRFYNGKWGFQQRIAVGDDGNWKVTGKHAKSTTVTRS